MFSLSVLSSCLLLFFAVAQAQDVTLSDEVSGASAKVLGQSGKINFYLNNQTMQVTIRSLTELDASGSAVGTTGSADEKHSFNSFASKDFVFSEVFSEEYQGLATSRVNFTCTLFAGATNLQVQLILFLEEGTVNIRDTTFAVERGSFKYTYNIDYWPFCTLGGTGNTLCTKGQTTEVGAFLDFEIIMKSGSDSNATVSNEPLDDNSNVTTAVVDWSDGGEMIFPGQYEEVSATGERVWKDLPVGYPLFEEKGGSDITTLRFTRFEAAVEYDPIVTLPTVDTDDAPVTDDGDANGGNGARAKPKSKRKPKSKSKPKKKHNEYMPVTFTASPTQPWALPAEDNGVSLSSDEVTTTNTATSTTTAPMESLSVALLSGVAVACVVAIVAVIRSKSPNVKHERLPDDSERAVDTVL